MGTTKLQLYNAALIEVGDRTLASETENVEARRLLDSVYDAALEECLSAGEWNFAVRPVQVDADTRISPNFGETEVFAKPSDWIRTFAVSGDENFAYPLTNYQDEPSRWVSNISPMYIKYVSNGVDYGLKLTAWPRAFTRYVELELAYRICGRINQNRSMREVIDRDRRRAKRQALNEDTMNEAQPKFFPSGSWTTARWGRGAGRQDRGSRNNLTG